MNSELILFGIDAGVRLGQKLYDVLVDATVERPLILPVGELFGNVTENDAIEFFDEHPDLTGPDGPYRGLSRPDKLKAYKTLKQIDGRTVGSGDVSAAAIDIVVKLEKFRQFEAGFGARPAVQKVIGTIVEIGIDYFVAHPEAIGTKSSERKILQAFVENLDDTQFAEGTRIEVVGDLLVASLETLNSNPAFVSDNDRTQALVGGITDALLADLDSSGNTLRRRDLAARIGSSILKGGLKAFSENIDLFLPEDEKSKPLVASTLTNLLEGINGKETLFTNESIELLFDSALLAVAQNADVFTDDAVLQQLVRNTLTAVTDANGSKVFSPATASAVLNEALLVVAEHADTLLDANNPGKQLLADATRAVALSLSGKLADGGTIKDLLTSRQLVSLVGIVFEEVAAHPENLLGDSEPGDRKTALAQIIGSVARAIGSEPERLITADGFLRLVRIALRTAAKNTSKLLDLDTQATARNLLSQVIEQAAEAFDEAGDDIDFLDGEVFVDLLAGILPVVSANVAGLEATPNAVKETVTTVLSLAGDQLDGRINGDNLPHLSSRLLTQVLWQELDLNEITAVVLSSKSILRAA